MNKEEELPGIYNLNEEKEEIKSEESVDIKEENKEIEGILKIHSDEENVIINEELKENEEKEKEEKEEEKEEIIKIKEEVFDNMMTDQGVTIGEINEKGGKVLLYFIRALGKKKPNLKKRLCSLYGSFRRYLYVISTINEDEYIPSDSIQGKEGDL
jgi:hypothetical protein